MISRNELLFILYIYYCNYRNDIFIASFVERSSDFVVDYRSCKLSLIARTDEFILLTKPLNPRNGARIRVIAMVADFTR